MVNPPIVYLLENCIECEEMVKKIKERGGSKLKFVVVKPNVGTQIILPEHAKTGFFGIGLLEPHRFINHRDRIKAITGEVIK